MAKNKGNRPAAMFKFQFPQNQEPGFPEAADQSKQAGQPLRIGLLYIKNLQIYQPG